MEEILARLAALERRADLALYAQVCAACVALRAPYEARNGEGYSYLVHAMTGGICLIECFDNAELSEDFIEGFAQYGLDAVYSSGEAIWLSVRYLEVY